MKITYFYITPEMRQLFNECAEKRDYKEFHNFYKWHLKELSGKLEAVKLPKNSLFTYCVHNFMECFEHLILPPYQTYLKSYVSDLYKDVQWAITNRDWERFYRKYRESVDYVMRQANEQQIINIYVVDKNINFPSFFARDCYSGYEDPLERRKTTPIHLSKNDRSKLKGQPSMKKTKDKCQDICERPNSSTVTSNSAYCVENNQLTTRCMKCIQNSHDRSPSSNGNENNSARQHFHSNKTDTCSNYRSVSSSCHPSKVSQSDNSNGNDRTFNSIEQTSIHFKQNCAHDSPEPRIVHTYENTVEIAKNRAHPNMISLHPHNKPMYENTISEQFREGQDRSYENCPLESSLSTPCITFEAANNAQTEQPRGHVDYVNVNSDKFTYIHHIIDEKERKMSDEINNSSQLDRDRLRNIVTILPTNTVLSEEQPRKSYHTPINIYENFYGISPKNCSPPPPNPRTSSLSSKNGNPSGPKLEEFHNTTSVSNVEPNICDVTPGKYKNGIDRYQSELDSSQPQNPHTATISVNIRRNSEQSRVENDSRHYQKDDMTLVLVSGYDTPKPFEVKDVMQGSSLKSYDCLNDSIQPTCDGTMDTLKYCEWDNTLRKNSEEMDISDVSLEIQQPQPLMLGDLWSDLDMPKPSPKPALRSNLSVDIEDWKRYAEDVKQHSTNAFIDTEPFDPKITEKEYSEDEEQNTTMNRDFDRKFQEQTERNQEELRRKREERAARRRKHEEELNKMRQESKQKYLMFFNCLGLKLRFEEQEHNWMDWIQGCKQCVSKLLEVFNQFVSEVRRNYRGLKHLSREDEADFQTEISFLLSDITNTYNSLEDSFEQLTHLESRFEDVMFIKVLKKCIAESATRLLKAYTATGTLSEHASQDNFQILQNTFDGLTPSLIYSTSDLRRICKENSYSDNYENVQFPHIPSQNS